MQELAYGELRKQGFTLICADAPNYFLDDGGNPSLKLIRQMLGAVSEYQKDEIVLKLKGARERKKAANKKTVSPRKLVRENVKETNDREKPLTRRK